MDVGEATRLYQAVLEEQRQRPDEDLDLEVRRARAEMERIWLEGLAVRASG